MKKARDAIVGVIVVLAPFAYESAVAGEYYTAGVTGALVGLLVLLYRYADARVLEELAQADPADAEELKPILRRLGRALRRLR